jgi:apolipoprotein N-acyltransferase
MLLGALFVCVALIVVPTSKTYLVAVAMPAAFVLSDWVRARFPLGGFPLGGTSLGQASSPIVPTVRLGGSLLLTAEAALIGVVLALLARLLAGVGRSNRLRDVLRFGGAETSVAIPALASSVLAVAIPTIAWISPSGATGRLPSVSSALIQGGGPRGTRAIHTDPQVVFDRHIALQYSIRPPVGLIVMPEGVLQTGEQFTDTQDAAEIVGMAQKLDSTVVAGVEQDVGTKRYLNEVAAWAPSGVVAAIYVKNHLVPFGEYVPWRAAISRVFNVSDVPLDAIAGHSTGYMKTPAAPLAVMISYEVFFDERARAGVRSGGQVLVVPTNTASYRSSQVPTQELAAS